MELMEMKKKQFSILMTLYDLFQIKLYSYQICELLLYNKVDNSVNKVMIHTFLYIVSVIFLASFYTDPLLEYIIY